MLIFGLLLVGAVFAGVFVGTFYLGKTSTAFAAPQAHGTIVTKTVIVPANFVCPSTDATTHPFNSGTSTGCVIATAPMASQPIAMNIVWSDPAAATVNPQGDNWRDGSLETPRAGYSFFVQWNPHSQLLELVYPGTAAITSDDPITVTFTAVS